MVTFGQLACLSLALGAAACGGPSPAHQVSASSSATTGSVAPAGPTCAKVTTQEVGAALGRTVSGPVVHTSSVGTSCIYASGQYRDYAVVYLRQSSPSQFPVDAAKLAIGGATTSTLPGLGDSAMAVSLGTGPGQTNTVSALQGSVAVTVTAPAPLSSIESLVQEILATL